MFLRYCKITNVAYEILKRELIFRTFRKSDEGKLAKIVGFSNLTNHRYTAMVDL